MMNNRPRALDLGVKIGILEHGEKNSITDVENVSVGHVTIIEGSGKLKIGSGPIRTGVTAILPHQENIFEKKLQVVQCSSIRKKHTEQVRTLARAALSALLMTFKNLQGQYFR